MNYTIRVLPYYLKEKDANNTGQKSNTHQSLLAQTIQDQLPKTIQDINSLTEDQQIDINNTISKYEILITINQKTYILQQLLGSGSFAHVFLAKRDTEDTLYAIKLARVSRNAQQNKQIKKVMQHDIDMCAKLKTLMDTKPCKYLVKICDYTENNKFNQSVDTSHAAIVFEYCEGGNLSKNKSSIYMTNILTLMHNICCAIDYLHNNGLVHRDIKSANIMITTKNNQTLYKLIDYGLALEIGDKEKMLAGSLFAPECIARYPFIYDYKKCDLRAVDIFAFGVTIDKLLHKNYFFYFSKINNIANIYENNFEGLFSLPYFSSENNIKLLLCRMLDRNPKNRPTACEIISELDKIDKTSQLELQPIQQLDYQETTQVQKKQQLAQTLQQQEYKKQILNTMYEIKNGIILQLETGHISARKCFFLYVVKVLKMLQESYDTPQKNLDVVKNATEIIKQIRHAALDNKWDDLLGHYAYDKLSASLIKLANEDYCLGLSKLTSVFLNIPNSKNQQTNQENKTDIDSVVYRDSLIKLQYLKVFNYILSSYMDLFFSSAMAYDFNVSISIWNRSSIKNQSVLNIQTLFKTIRTVSKELLKNVLNQVDKNYIQTKQHIQTKQQIPINNMHQQHKDMFYKILCLYGIDSVQQLQLDDNLAKTHSQQNQTKQQISADEEEKSQTQNTKVIFMQDANLNTVSALDQSHTTNIASSINLTEHMSMVCIAYYRIVNSSALNDQNISGRHIPSILATFKQITGGPFMLLNKIKQIFNMHQDDKKMIDKYINQLSYIAIDKPSCAVIQDLDIIQIIQKLASNHDITVDDFVELFVQKQNISSMKKEQICDSIKSYIINVESIMKFADYSSYITSSRQVMYDVCIVFTVLQCALRNKSCQSYA